MGLCQSVYRLFVTVEAFLRTLRGMQGPCKGLWTSDLALETSAQLPVTYPIHFWGYRRSSEDSGLYPCVCSPPGFRFFPGFFSGDEQT